MLSQFNGGARGHEEGIAGKRPQNNQYFTEKYFPNAVPFFVITALT
jgi:hypothetical protein